MITMLSLAALSGLALAADCVVIEGATVHLPEGPAEGVSVRIEGARIAAVGPNLDPSGCERVDARGQELTAGFVDAHTSLGLVEVGMVSDTHDDQGGHAAYQVIDGYNPLSTLIPITRVAGTTSALVVPGGGLVSGQSAFVQLAGGTQADAIVAPSVALYVHLGASFGRGLDELGRLLDDAEDYAANRAAYEQDRTRDFVAPAPDLEALQPALKGAQPLVVDADRASDIEALLRFAEARGLRVVLRGGAEAWLHAEALAAAGVAVMLDPYVYNPGSFDQVHARPDNAALLHAAGVDVIIASSSAHFARGLRQLAGNAVREGLPHEAGLAAITATPARVFGLEGFGRVEVGAVADLALWSGDPLEVGTQLVALRINGAPISLETRQTKLRDRYLTLPGTPAPLPLPND